MTKERGSNGGFCTASPNTEDKVDQKKAAVKLQLFLKAPPSFYKNRYKVTEQLNGKQ
jgi:hypothetical protein